VDGPPPAPTLPPTLGTAPVPGAGAGAPPVPICDGCPPVAVPSLPSSELEHPKAPAAHIVTSKDIVLVIVLIPRCLSRESLAQRCRGEPLESTMWPQKLADLRTYAPSDRPQRGDARPAVRSRRTTLRMRELRNEHRASVAGSQLAHSPAMIGRLLGSTELKQLASFVSPAFFEVMPPKPLFAKAKSLRGTSKNPEAIRHAILRREATLSETALPITLGEAPPDGAEGEGPEIAAERRANAVVQLYFHQLLTDDAVLLDLRHESFTAAADRLYWEPSPWIAEFSPEFLTALRRIYRGFYAGDDAEFRSGLAALDLQNAEDVFRRQFGTDVHHVVFRTTHFVSTFHEVFLRCKRAGKSLHADFLPLGIELAALYEHLETLGVAVDVARCFEEAAKRKAS
jgi:hypothetical protein